VLPMWFSSEWRHRTNVRHRDERASDQAALEWGVSVYPVISVCDSRAICSFFVFGSGFPLLLVSLSFPFW
jgi:hypothetical protein